MRTQLTFQTIHWLKWADSVSTSQTTFLQIFIGTNIFIAKQHKCVFYTRKQVVALAKIDHLVKGRQCTWTAALLDESRNTVQIKAAFAGTRTASNSHHCCTMMVQLHKVAAGLGQAIKNGHKYAFRYITTVNSSIGCIRGGNPFMFKHTISTKV